MADFGRFHAMGLGAFSKLDHSASNGLCGVEIHEILIFGAKTRQNGIRYAKKWLEWCREATRVVPEWSQSRRKKVVKIEKSRIRVEKSRNWGKNQQNIGRKSRQNDACSIFRRRSFDARRSRLARNVKSAGCLLGGVVRQLVECVYCLWNVSNACLMCLMLV